MTETKKPAWVEALDNAKLTLTNAGTEHSPEMIDAKTRLAYGWINVAGLLKDEKVAP